MTVTMTTEGLLRNEEFLRSCRYANITFTKADRFIFL